MNQPTTQDPKLKNLDRLAWFLDNSIRVPGTSWRIGFDGLIGLIPGLGDIAGAALASLIVVQGLRSGAPASLVLRMGFNVLLETVVGFVPLLGDLFDFSFKANSRNVRLLRQHHEKPAASRTRNRLFMTMVILLFFAALVGLVVLGFAVASWAWEGLSQML